jgi:hypothetical protein
MVGASADRSADQHAFPLIPAPAAQQVADQFARAERERMLIAGTISTRGNGSLMSASGNAR